MKDNSNFGLLDKVSSFQLGQQFAREFLPIKIIIEDNIHIEEYNISVFVNNLLYER